ncbi:hypothetical protein [Pandoraea horticolens]|nr:hypothetical protein [Pandoraea horticolens]
MQQDRRHLGRRADRQALRDTLANHRFPPMRSARRTPSRDAGRRRGRGPWQLPPRAPGKPQGEAADGKPTGGGRCKTRFRGGAMLDVMFTLAALMAGAQGFAHWQAAGAMTSVELAPSKTNVALALPAQAGNDVWHARRYP